MLRLIEHWFEPVQPSQDYRRQDFILLALILAFGTWLRFWHLGNVGLHGDEDIMGLAARGIVEQGSPILPSGMYYARALLHSYVLAGSTIVFGDNEWALRLPSAIVGSLCGLFAFFMGRRFLDPKPNLVFVALIMFLPAMIDVSLTARMYVFYVAGLLIFATLLFRWERTGKTTPFLLAFIAWLVTIQFHPLAVFAAPLFLFPGLANRSWKQLVVGAITVLAAVVIGGVLGHIASLNYPEESERLILQPEAKQTPLELLFQGHLRLALAVAVAVAVAVFVIGTFRVERWKTVLPAVLLLALGAAACVKLHYHIGAIALLFGTILWLRAGTLHNSRLPIVGAIVAVTALAQFYLLHGTGEFPGRTLIGAFVGSPSVWPTLRFVEFSLGGIAVLAVTVAFATCRLAGGRRIPLYFLFFAMAVWAPLVAIGLFRWDVALRYTLGMLPFFLLIAIAACTYLVQNVSWIASALQRPVFAATAGFMLIAIIVNPVAVWRTAQNDYRNHPDHKGAAEFIRSLNLDADDIIIAEDCINQTYYLGKVDYRLQNVLAARKHSVLRNGVLYGQYTSAPVIGSGRMLKDVLEREPVSNIYIIGNSEGAKNWLRQNRENGIAEVLASGHLEVIFVGRDRKTTVWRLRR